MELREKGTRGILLCLQKVHDKHIYIGIWVGKDYQLQNVIRYFADGRNPETSGVECRDNDTQNTLVV